MTRSGQNIFIKELIVNLKHRNQMILFTIQMNYTAACCGELDPQRLKRSITNALKGQDNKAWGLNPRRLEHYEYVP